MPKIPKSRRFNFPKAIAPLFKQRGASLMLHNTDKFELRFLPSAGDAFYSRFILIGLTVLFAIVCAVMSVIVTIVLFYNFFILAASALTAIGIYFSRGFFQRYITARLLGDCHARGIICNASFFTFTVWSRLNNADQKSITIPFNDVLDVVSIRGNALALATRDGKFYPFTRSLRNPDAARELQRFLKNITTLDTTRVPHLLKTDPPPPTDPKLLYEKQHGSTPLRFSKRVSRNPAKFFNQRNLVPPSY